MNRRRTRQDQKASPADAHAPDFLAEATSTPLDGDLFMNLVDIAIEALEGRRLVLPPAPELCLENSRGGLRLTDIPENQMGLSIVGECRRRFGRRGRPISRSFFLRWFAILSAENKGCLEEFIRKQPGGELEVSEAVFRAAADCPINREGEFDQATYLGRIRELARNEVLTPPK